jgi:hypothetical protein
MTTKNEETRPDPPLEELPEVVQAILDRYGLANESKRKAYAAEGLEHLRNRRGSATGSKHEVAILAVEVSRLQTELVAAQDALLQGIDADALQAVNETVALAMSGVDVEEDEGRPAPDFQGFVAALREEAEWIATIHKEDDSQAVSDQGSLYRLAIRAETTARGLGLWEDGPQEPATAEPVEIDMGELVAPDPLRVWPVFIRTADHDPYFAIRGDGTVFFRSEPQGRLPATTLVPLRLPAGAALGRWFGLLLDFTEHEAPEPIAPSQEEFTTFRNSVDCDINLDTFDLALGYFAGRGVDIDGEAQGMAAVARDRVLAAEPTPQVTLGDEVELLPPANPDVGQTWRDGEQLRQYDGEVWEAVDDDEGAP